METAVNKKKKRGQQVDKTPERFPECDALQLICGNGDGKSFFLNLQVCKIKTVNTYYTQVYLSIPKNDFIKVPQREFHKTPEAAVVESCEAILKKLSEAALKKLVPAIHIQEIEAHRDRCKKQLYDTIGLSSGHPLDSLKKPETDSGIEGTLYRAYLPIGQTPKKNLHVLFPEPAQERPDFVTLGFVYNCVDTVEPIAFKLPIKPGYIVTANDENGNPKHVRVLEVFHCDGDRLIPADKARKEEFFEEPELATRSKASKSKKFKWESEICMSPRAIPVPTEGLDVINVLIAYYEGCDEYPAGWRSGYSYYLAEKGKEEQNYPCIDDEFFTTEEIAIIDACDSLLVNLPSGVPKKQFSNVAASIQSFQRELALNTGLSEVEKFFPIGTIFKTNYSDREYKLTRIVGPCDCSEYLDSIELHDKAPKTPVHFHFEASEAAEEKSKNPFIFNQYAIRNSKLSSVVSVDELIILLRPEESKTATAERKPEKIYTLQIPETIYAEDYKKRPDEKLFKKALAAMTDEMFWTYYTVYCANVRTSPSENHTIHTFRIAEQELIKRDAQLLELIPLENRTYLEKYLENQTLGEFVCIVYNQLKEWIASLHDFQQKNLTSGNDYHWWKSRYGERILDKQYFPQGEEYFNFRKAHEVIFPLLWKLYETSIKRPIGRTAVEPETTTPPAQELKASTTASPKFNGYPGSKMAASSYMKIINQLPPHDTFISGFLGECAVLAHKKPAAKNFGVEINLEKVKPFWDSLNRPDIKLFREDFFSFITKFSFSKQMKERLLIYLDPPYKLSTRRSGAVIYENELTDEQHQELITLADNITALSDVMIAISHYPCPEYDELLKNGWRKIEWTVQTHQGPATEALYMNYPEPTELHEYTFLGENKTERQRIKRKKARAVAKLLALKKESEVEYNAILAAVSELSTPPSNKRK